MRNFKVTVDGQVYNVSVEEIIGQSQGQAAPAPIPVSAPVPAIAAPVPQVQAAPEPAPQAAQTSAAQCAADGIQIKSPMPGMILDYKVSNGSVVKKGQTVMVLEAMKMENDICSSADGTITFVADKGSNVSTGDIIAVIS